MKRIIYSFIILLMIGFQSCEDVVEGLNNDPNNFTDAPLNLVLNHANLNVVAIAEAHPARIATIFTDQFGGNDRQYGTLNIYSTLQTDYDEVWEDLFQRGISQAQIAKQKAQDAGNAQLEGQAQILEAYFFAEGALLFGDIPFSQVNDPDFLDPEFEGQVAVLNSVVSMLQEGATLVGTSSADNNVFNTSSSWAQIANALRARYLLALGDNAGALSAAQAANFTSKANDWEIIHTTTNYAENLFYQFQVEQRQDYLKVLGSIDHSYMSKLLNSTAAEYKGNSKTDESGRYAYYVSADGEDLNTSPGGFAGIDTNFPVVSYEEMQLIIAETSVGSDNAAALAALNAVRASNAAMFPTGQYDAYVIADFQAGGELYDGNSENSSLMMEIMLEKYCAVIGLPTYSDVRRTDNMIGVPIKGTGTTVIPQRYLYPQTESASNENFPGLVDQFTATPVNQ
ncbi:SusD/RagB family nutrient-binding outer membrane lipoprotein [Ekhidna sp.]|uniref:SusD/RagB family nutrient-binding outer membrane lipoprotein n=1 Tax=Ekhidna sp. TaxID=2608089 RepID=UPI003CCBBA47